MKITLEMLKTKSACQEQVDIFKETFGDSVEVTKENCIKAVKVHLDFNWSANNLLNRKQKAAYKEAEAPLRAAYKEAEAPLWAAYKEAEALAFYNAVTGV